MASRVDVEVKKIIDTAFKQATDILKKQKKKLDLIANELVQKETLEQEEFESLMKKVDTL
jgi:cell division protease FtsH